MIKHAGYWKPVIYPWNGTADRAEIDRLQEFRGAPTLPVDQIYEIGRYEKVCSIKRPPEVAISQRQFEYGSIEYYLKLANKESGDNVTLADFDESFFHLVGYEGNSEDVIDATILFPTGRLNGFGLSIAGPEDVIERTYDISADTKIIWQNANKYFIFKTFTIASGDIESSGATEITLSDPFPVQDPDTLSYVYEVLRVRASDTEELVEGSNDDFTYSDGTHILTVEDSEPGDVIKVYYTAGVYVSGQEPHQVNDADACALYAYNASIYLVDGVNSYYMHRLNTLNIEVTFDRQDVKEIGNKDTVETGIRTRTVRVSTSGFVKDYTLEEVLRGKAGLDYGKIDIEKLKDTIALVVKIYDDSDKENFLIGYQVENLAVAGLDKGVPVNDFVTKAITLESDNLLITTDEDDLLIPAQSA